MDVLKLRNKLTNGHDLTIAECEYLKSLMGADDDHPVKAAAEIAATHRPMKCFYQRLPTARMAVHWLSMLCGLLVDSLYLR